jgi:hypothetical protein
MRIVTGIWGDKFQEGYVDAMRAQVPEIIVLGRDHPYLTQFPGFFRKLELFAPWFDFLRPCVWLDLDTYVLGDITPLTELTDELWLINDLYHSERAESGIMVAPSYSDHIWAKAPAAAASNTYYGDGPFLATFPHRRIQSAVDGIMSYKAGQLYDSPKNARIVCFHGKPKPHETDGWALAYWNTKTSLTKN